MRNKFYNARLNQQSGIAHKSSYYPRMIIQLCLIFSGWINTSVAADLVNAQSSVNEKINLVKSTPVDSLIPMLFGLGAILIVIFGLAVMLKKMTGLRLISQNIKLIESQSLGAKEKLVIVEVQDEQYLLGVTAHTISAIATLDHKIEKQPVSMPFDRLLKQFLPAKEKVKKSKSILSAVTECEVD